LATPYNLVVVTPERVLLSDQAVITIAPGADGELGVMANHAALMTELVPGEVKATLADGRTTSHIVISGGFMEVTAERTTILADTAERADEIDVTRAEADLSAARSMLADAAVGSPEAAQALQAVQLGEARLRAGRGTTGR
jgi:F-type H+-transporting ATPase subunit epsilon